MRLQSGTSQVINDGEKGQINDNINVEISQYAVHNNAQMEYNGQVITGVTTIVPQFYVEYDESGDDDFVRIPITQGVPTVLNYPTSVISALIEAEAPRSGQPTGFGTRETYALLFALRRIISRELQSPLFGLSQVTQWNVVTD